MCGRSGVGRPTTTASTSTWSGGSVSPAAAARPWPFGAARPLGTTVTSLWWGTTSTTSTTARRGSLTASATAPSASWWLGWSARRSGPRPRPCWASGPATVLWGLGGPSTQRYTRGRKGRCCSVPATSASPTTDASPSAVSRGRSLRTILQCTRPERSFSPTHPPPSSEGAPRGRVRWRVPAGTGGGGGELSKGLNTTRRGALRASAVCH
mmetsp:Transcript_10235/g.30819  ORF Transcript_10235/g.30819 Transcript_10235/m.30819 type:complete len:210 (+) Transcript_10235:308-937(+)